MYDSITQKVLDHLDGISFKYDIVHNDDDRTVLKAGMGGGPVNFVTHIKIEPEQGMIQCSSAFPVNAQPDQIGRIAEVLHRANWGLRLGNFELDYSDGEIRYHTTIIIEDTVLSDAMLRHLFAANWSTLNRYAPALLKVLYAGASPRQAIAEIENGPDDLSELLADAPVADEPDAEESRQMQELMDLLMADDAPQAEDPSANPTEQEDRDAA